jgi:integrase/recombinase XerC
MDIRSFIQYLQFEKRYSKHTITAYENDLTQYSDYLKITYEITDLSQVRHTQIRSWLVSLMEGGTGSRSINRKISTLKSYYKFLIRNGVLQKDPMQKVVSPKVSKRLPVFVEEKNIREFLNHYDFGDTYEGIRDHLIIELFYSTGMRLSELVNLTDDSVNFYGNTIKVLGKGNKERIIPFHTEVMVLMKEYMAVRDKQFSQRNHPFLFLTEKGDKIYQRLVYRVINHYLQIFTTVEKKSPHVLRHTFATHLLNHGAEINAIKELLGHANLAATQVYTHNTIDKLKNIYKQAHPKA